MATICLDKLGFRYPGASADTLSDLNLTIADGEAHALLGASGAGKTTLLNILSGLLAPTSGALRFDDKDVSQLAGRERNVAQVFQFPVLYESLSVADNLAFPLRTRGAPAGLIAERRDHIVSELELRDILEHKPRNLSLFQKQLVAVGKALIRPDVSMVLLDEPLTAVEPKIKWQLRQTLRRVQADLKVTMVYVTHDQTEALTFAENVSVLASGSILQTGTPEQVYAEPLHEFVGHFVGSPGMNFLPAGSLGVTDAQRVGFRPEWGRIVSATDSVQRPQGGLQGTLRRLRIEGTQGGRPTGLVTVETPEGEVAVRGALPDNVPRPGDALQVQVDRCIAYEQQLMVRTIELV